MPSESRLGADGSFGRRPAWRFSICVFGFLLLGHVLCSPIGRAQVTSITSSGLNTTVTQNGATHDITGGTQRGSNLFHSFGQFSVGTGDIANFNNVNSLPVGNILGRVTGGGISNIYGTIQTTNFGTANLFLINPAGWIFGPGASLNVGGSFHVSTANYISLRDGVQFSAAPGPGDALLTSAPPTAFGFLGPTVAPISVEGNVLTVAEGMTLSLVGGDVSITGTTLHAPSGRIQIAGVASAGEVTIPNLDVSSFSSLGQITISADSVGTPSILDSSGTPIFDDFGTLIGGGVGGEIIIRGGRLVVSDSTLQTAGYGSLDGATPRIDVAVTDDIVLGNSVLNVSGQQVFDIDGGLIGGAGGAVVLRGASLTANGSVMFAGTSGISNGATLGIDIEVTNDIAFGGGSLLLAFTEGAGNGGGVRLSAESVQLQEFAGISTITAGTGQAGDIGIKAASVTLDTASITTETFGSGAGGEVSVNVGSAGSLIMSNGSGISSVSSADGAGGRVFLASPSIALDGLSFVLSQSFGTATGGDLVVEAGELTLTGGANLKSETGGAPGGNISVTATTGALMISGEGSGIISGGSGVEGAPAGSISLDARQLTVTGGGVIQNGTILDSAGSIFIAATDSIVISDRGKILSQAFVNDVGDVTISAPTANLVMDTGLIQTSTLLQGNAGDIHVNVATLSMTNGAQIVTSSASGATGRGGDLTITANSVSISGSSPGDPVSVLSGSDPSSGLFSTASQSLDALAKGGGQITVTTPLLTISDGAKISAFTPGAGPAGSISLNASTLSVAGEAQVVSSTTSSGAAGSIAVVGTQVDIFSGGRVISESGGLLGDVVTVGTGSSGSVSITATNAINVSGPGSSVSTTTFGDGAGGDVALSANQVNVQDGGRVTSESGGLLGGAPTVGGGDSGSVSITATSAINVSGPGSSVSTTTFGDGAGGGVSLSATQVNVQDGGRVTSESGGLLGGAASVGTGDSGSVSVSAGDTITVSGQDSVVSTSTFGGGQGGDVTLDAGNQVSVLSGGRVAGESGGTVAVGTGSGGSVSISAGNAITVSDAGSAVSTTTFGDGAGGGVTLSAAQVAVQNGGSVTSESGGLIGGSPTVGSGDSGSVSITATNAINVSGPGSSVSTTTHGDGAGGNVSLSATQVGVQNGGRVTSESGGLLGGVVAVGAGGSGTVSITAGTAITVSGQGSVVSTSTFGDGNGGNVVLNAGDQVAILDGGHIAADSGGTLGGSVVSGSGLGGNIEITAGNQIYLENGQITTQTLTADGGNITLMAPKLVRLQDSVISTSVQGGLGTGGNILIHPEFVIVNNSSIIANAFGGPGGNITIIADNFLASADSVIEASSALSTPGVIEIRSPENNVESSIAQLPGAFLDASALLRGLCTARRTGAASSFVVAGRGGVPVDADGYLPSFGTDVAASVATASGSTQVDAGRINRPVLAVALLLPNDLDCGR